MIIPNPLQFLRSRDRPQPRREFCEWRSGISDEIHGIRWGPRSGSRTPETGERFVGEGTHGGWESRFGRIGGVCVTTVRVGGAWPISVHFGGWRLVMRWIHITYRISDDAAAVTLYWSGTFRSGTFRGHEEGGNKRVWTDPGRLLVVSYFLGVPSDVLSFMSYRPNEFGCAHISFANNRSLFFQNGWW